MNHFDWLDGLVVVIYSVGIVIFGLRYGKGQRTTRDYFLGSHRIPWWAVGLSIVATETSAVTFISIPALAYGSDLTFLQIIVGYVIARILLTIFLIPAYFRGDIYSPYEMLGQAFGPGARRTVATFFLIAGTLAAGVRVYVTCIPLQLMLGLAEGQIMIAVMLFVGVSLIYTYVGGVKAVIWTDAAQFFAFVIGGLFVLFFVPTLIDGGWGQALGMASDAGKLEWFRSGLDQPGGVPALFTGPLNIWMGLIGATVLVMSSHGADQLIVQRVLSCGTVRDGRRAMLLSAAIIFPLFVLFLMVGIFLWVYYQLHPEIGIPVPEARPGVGKNDYLFPIFILTELPHGMKGFLLVGILCAAMSSVSSALSALASVSTMDLYRPIARPDCDDKHFLKMSKRATLFWALMLILVAWWTQNTVSALTTAFALSGLTSGGLLAGVLLSLWWRQGRSLPIVVGMVVSLACMIGIKTGTAIAWPWYTLIGFSVAVGVAALVRAFFGGDGVTVEP